MAAARDPELGAFAIQLRYLRGRSSRRSPAVLIEDVRPLTPLDEALFSGVLAGEVRSHVDCSELVGKQLIRAELESLAALLRLN